MMLKLAILGAAIYTIVGTALLIAVLVSGWAWGWRATMEPREDGRRSRVRWLLVIGLWLAGAGLLGLVLLPAMQPAVLSQAKVSGSGPG